jgi:GTP-binding protein
VVHSKSGVDFVLADIPGLIEGASQGHGLGHQFLKHIERTKLLIHVVDASGAEGEPVDRIKTINNELENYNTELLKRPQIIAANKIDVDSAKEYLPAIESYANELGFKVFHISAAGNQGLDALMQGVSDSLKDCPSDIVFESDYYEYDDEETVPFTVKKVDDGVFSVNSQGIDRMLGYTNLETEKGMAFFQKYMRDKGIIAELESLGIIEGDTVQVSDLYFDYYK